MVIKIFDPTSINTTTNTNGQMRAPILVAPSDSGGNPIATIEVKTESAIPIANP